MNEQIIFRTPPFDVEAVRGRVMTVEDAALLFDGRNLPVIADARCQRKSGHCNSLLARLRYSRAGWVLSTLAPQEPGVDLAARRQEVGRLKAPVGVEGKWELVGVSTPISSNAWCPRHGYVEFDRERLLALGRQRRRMKHPR